MVAPSFVARATAGLLARARTFGSRAASILGVVALVSGSIVVAVAVGATSAQAASTVSVHLASDSATVLPGSTVTVTALIRNSGKTALKPGTLSVFSSAEVLATSADLTSWMSGKSAETANLAVVKTPTIPPTSSVNVTATFAATRLAHPSSWGVRGLAGTVSVGSQPVASARSSVVLLAGQAPAAVNVATIVPLVSSPSALGLMTSAELEAATSEQGYLGHALSASSTRTVTLAVDPRITTSILTLGAEAPGTAKNWLTALESSGLPGFWLSYADADLSGQIQAGAAAPISPGISDLPNIPAPPAGGQWGGSVWPGWNPSLFAVAWPAAGTVSTKSLTSLSAQNVATMLLSSTNVIDATARTSSASVNDSPTVIINQSASDCAGDIQSQNDPVLLARDKACIASQVALASTSARGNSNVVITLSRTPASTFSADLFDEAVNSISRLAFARPIPLSAVMSSAPQTLTLASRSESKTRLRSLTGALEHQESIVTFSIVATEPERVINPGARRLAAFASTAWIGNPAWATAADENAALTREVLNSVSIVTSSTINMVGGQARIPVVVRNGLPSGVSVLVHGIPSNARLVVERDVSLRIEAESQSRAYIPVSARVGSGRVELEVSLTDLAGNRVGTVTLLPVNVRADWEGWGLLGLSVVFIALVVAGVFRTLRRKRQPRTESDG